MNGLRNKLARLQSRAFTHLEHSVSQNEKCDTENLEHLGIWNSVSDKNETTILSQNLRSWSAPDPGGDAPAADTRSSN